MKKITFQIPYNYSSRAEIHIVAFAWQEWSRERATMLRCTYMACLAQYCLFEDWLASELHIKIQIIPHSKHIPSPL